MDNKTPASSRKIYLIVTAVVMVSVIFYFFTALGTQPNTITSNRDAKSDASQVTIKQSMEQQVSIGPKKFGTITVAPGGISQADITISGGK